MSERTERSEGHERMPRGGGGMSERTERSEGHERMPKESPVPDRPTDSLRETEQQARPNQSLREAERGPA